MGAETPHLYAIRPEQTAVFFQPKIEISTGAIAGYEALLRLRGQNGAMLSPSSLLAEVAALGGREALLFHRKLLERVLPEAYAVQRDTDLPVSVNIHPRLLEDDTVIRWLIDQRVHGITLELIESSDIEDFQRANASIERLQRNGFQFSIDDYGRAFATAAMLTNLPTINEVKIDAMFLRTPRGASLLPGMCRNIHSADADATIEGVETLEDHQICVESGADFAQGFWHGLPLPAPIATHAVA